MQVLARADQLRRKALCTLKFNNKCELRARSELRLRSRPRSSCSRDFGCSSACKAKSGVRLSVSTGPSRTSCGHPPDRVMTGISSSSFVFPAISLEFTSFDETFAYVTGLLLLLCCCYPYEYHMDLCNESCSPGGLARKTLFNVGHYAQTVQPFLNLINYVEVPRSLVLYDVPCL